MIYLPAALSFIASALCVALGLLHLFRGSLTPQKGFFVASLLTIALAQAMQGMLFLQGEVVAAMTVFRFLLAATMLVPAFSIPFFALFGKRDDHNDARARGPLFAIAMIVVGALALLLPADLVVSGLQFADGLFWAVGLTRLGVVLTVMLLLTIVVSLYFLENTWRSASVAEKATLKYPLLGVVTASVVWMIVFGRVLAIPVIDRTFMAVGSAAVITLVSAFFFATLRYHLFDVQVAIGRNVASSVVSVVISGAYLFALGVISYAARTLGVAFDRLTIQVLLLFAAFLLAAILISGKARRRIRRYVDENFYLDRYDYRHEWRRNANMMTSTQGLAEFLPEFVNTLSETMMVGWGIVWVRAKGGRTAVHGLHAPPITTADLELITNRLVPQQVELLNSDSAAENSPLLADVTRAVDVRAVAAIGLGADASGVVVLGQKSLGLSYNEEDRDFLVTFSNQGALAIENLEMGEKIVDARQLDTFNRFASFVVHDLKNTVGMLSLTAENAKDNLHDVEFQRDAMETVRRSIEKMQRLIHSLGAVRPDASITTERLDMTETVDRALATLSSVAKARDIEVTFVGNGRVEVDADRGAINRIIENLVFNAMDASRRGDRVDVRVAAVADGVELTVTDHGAGFDPDYRENHMFRPFRSTKKEGLGVGLNMCKTLVEAHGGDITIHSEPGHGAVVTVRLPRQG